MDTAVDTSGSSNPHSLSKGVGAVFRARMDIRHCYVPNLPGVAQVTGPDGVTPQSIETKQPVVVIAKHLCGVATDLAIRSVGAFGHINRRERQSAGFFVFPVIMLHFFVFVYLLFIGDIAHRLGISIATCCHHACHFPDYTGRDWYLSQGFTSEEFEVLKKWSGWANTGAGSHRHSSTAGVAVEDDDQQEEEERKQNEGLEGQVQVPNTQPIKDISSSTDKDSNNIIATPSPTPAPAPAAAAVAVTSVVRPAGISADDMKALGWKVKRILDQGRVEFINSQYSMRARQVRYCDRELSPECVMIVATEVD